jgi:hypothetical protein
MTHSYAAYLEQVREDRKSCCVTIVVFVGAPWALAMALLAWLSWMGYVPARAVVEGALLATPACLILFLGLLARSWPPCLREPEWKAQTEYWAEVRQCFKESHAGASVHYERLDALIDQVATKRHGRAAGAQSLRTGRRDTACVRGANAQHHDRP